MAAANGGPELGVNFSHRHAAWLGLDPDALYRRLLDELGVRHVRLSVYWDEVAPAPDRIDYAPIRRWLMPLQERGGKALVTLGIKGQRHPEFYPPEWLTAESPLPQGAKLEQFPRVTTHLLLTLERLTAALADWDCIDGWQVENEPFLPAARRTSGYEISAALLEREVGVVRDVDPRHRPIVINHASLSRLDRTWLTALELGDVLAQNVYTRKPHPRWPGLWNMYAWWWLLRPNLKAQAWLARRQGKGFWITELQAEPWEKADVHTLPHASIRSVSPTLIEKNLRLVTKAGAERVYLWGAEWWWFAADKQRDWRYWELAGRLFKQAGVGARGAV